MTSKASHAREFPSLLFGILSRAFLVLLMVFLAFASGATAQTTSLTMNSDPGITLASGSFITTPLQTVPSRHRVALRR